jgi:diacylglycerol kinase (ATP)
LDGKLVELPHLESVVILNIPYWGGGVDPWNLGNANKNREDIATASINDGLLEVFGVYSSFHIAQMQVGLAEPFRIGQARHVCIKLFKRFPVQIDGEPWEQNPAVINISYFNQATMLQKSF